MTINWNHVEKQMGKAVANAIGPAWQSVSTGASTQFAATIAAGKWIERNQDMQPAEIESLKLTQQRALEGVLQTYEGISLVVARQAAAAACNVVTQALTAEYPGSENINCLVVARDYKPPG
jgi:hypothetical protein